ncbi:hypothetical protein RINTU1_12080 [Candidatus Regiella insecticola]|uniref:Uncharacterized protein n=1 Tax=Candidatus Regiella insecticola TaxID=138073 RepID=A0A6L2ZN79_9ENTR|nr:hypothetical protein RINTU1_12080 [Candidatus Regiella insecticola]
MKVTDRIRQGQLLDATLATPQNTHLVSKITLNELLNKPIAFSIVL